MPPMTSRSALPAHTTTLPAWAIVCSTASSTRSSTRVMDTSQPRHIGPMEAMDGTFTLNTDAELVSQNNENGAETVGSVKTIKWTATSDTPDAPMASIRVRAIP